MYSKSYRESSTSYFLVHFQKATTYKDTWCPSFIWVYKQDVKFHIASYLVQNHKMLFYCFQVYIFFIIIPTYVVENHKMNKHQQRMQRHITVMCRSRHQQGNQFIGPSILSLYSTIHIISQHCQRTNLLERATQNIESFSYYIEQT